MNIYIPPQSEAIYPSITEHSSKFLRKRKSIKPNFIGENKK